MEMEKGLAKNMLEEIFSSIKNMKRHRDYIISQAYSERTASLASHALGALWFVLTPLMEMLIYYILIAVIFQRGGHSAYPTFVGIMTGLIHYRVFQRIVSQSVTSIVDRRSTMLQVKIEPMSFVAISTLKALLDARYYVPLYIITLILYGVYPSKNIIWYPFILALLIMASWAIALLFSVTYVYFRDIREISTITLRLLLYMCPIIYPSTFVPEKYVDIYFLNPFATLFAMFKASILGDPFPPAFHMAYSVLFFFLLLVSAHILYNRQAGNLLKVM